MAVQHAKGDPPVEVGPDENLTTRLWERAESAGSTAILRVWADGGWQGITWGELAQRVRAVAAGLVAAGVEPGDRVALMSGTRPEWTVADLAILAAGAVTVPIYETSSQSQSAWILTDSGAVLALAGTADHAKNLDAARAQAPALGEVFVFDDGGLDALADRAGDEHRTEVDERARATRPTDLASIVYTSGTTGNPKGCMLTHGNVLWTVRQAAVQLRKILSGPDEATLLFLPLALVFARLVQLMVLEADVSTGFARSLGTLQADIASFRPTFLFAVPRVMDKVFNGAQRKAQGSKRRVFDFAVSNAAAWSSKVAAGRRAGPIVSAGHAVADRLVYSKIREALGGRLKYVISGGAPLSPHLSKFFYAAGIPLLEGYGMTETTAPACVNTPDEFRIGTCGRPLPGVEARVGDAGELLLRGGNVFAGYWENEPATREILTDDGWIDTGDLAEIDADGYVRITGRKKEIIVTSTGKNVAPAVLEERLKAHRLVSQAMVVGDDKPYVAALITLDPDELAAFADEKGLSGDAAALADADAVQAEMRAAVAETNATVSRAESIRKFKVLERDFTLEHDEMTPSLKLRRRNVAANFASEIEALFPR